jgi:hypothetical protein
VLQITLRSFSAQSRFQLHTIADPARHTTPSSSRSPTSSSLVLRIPPARLALKLTEISGNFALLPLRTRTRGPAQQLPALPADVTELTIDASHESYDPLDEILALFRANTFFRNFEIKGPADRVMIYGILYVSEVLSKIKPGMGRREAEKVGFNQALAQKTTSGRTDIYNRLS